MTSQVVPAEDKNVEPIVDREKTCPLLLRVFLSQGRHHSVTEYTRGGVPSNELQIYTWTDATLKELTALVKEVNAESRRKGTYFDFALVYPDMHTGGYRMKDIGSTCSGVKGVDDGKSLSTLRFQIGDYLDIAIHAPQNQSRGDGGRGGGGGGFGGGGGGGFGGGGGLGGGPPPRRQRRPY